MESETITAETTATTATQAEQKKINIDGTYLYFTDFISKEVQERFSSIQALIEYNKPKDAERMLTMLHNEHPQDPYVACYVAVQWFYGLSKMQKGLDIMQDTYMVHHDNLVVRSLFARLCIHAERFGAVMAIFQEKFQLDVLYPDKASFYVAEVAEFFYMLGLFCCSALGDKKTATAVYNHLKAVVWPEHPYLQSLDIEIKKLG